MSREFYVNARSDGVKPYSQLDIRDSWCDFGDYSLFEFGFLHNFVSCVQFQLALLVICCHNGVNASGSLGWNDIIITRFGDLRIIWGFQFGREMCFLPNFCGLSGFPSFFICYCTIFVRGVWPLRGIRIGEASHPGPAVSMQLYGDEEDLDDLLSGSIEMATRMVELMEEGAPNDTLPPTPFGPTALSPHHPADVEFVVPPTAIDVEDLPDEPGEVEMTSLVVDDEADVPAPVVPPPPPEIHEIGRVLRCPFCPRYSTEGQARGLMRHLNCKHAGATIDSHARVMLQALDRGICCNSDCKALRPLGSASCSYCRRCIAARRLVEGVVIPV